MADGVSDDGVIFFLAQQKADARILEGLAMVVVQNRQIELQLSEVPGIELLGFEFHGNQRPQFAMEQQQVAIIVMATHLQTILLAYKSEITAKLQKELLEIGDNSFPQFIFIVDQRQAKKFQRIGVTEQGSWS